MLSHFRIDFREFRRLLQYKINCLTVYFVDLYRAMEKVKL